MKKRFMHITLIGALALLIIFFGINIVDNFKPIDIKTLSGNIEALGDMDILANRQIGLFHEKRYVISDEDVESETTMKLDDNDGFDIYKNKDVFRFMWPHESNAFYGEKWLAAIRGDNNTLEIRVKDRKTGETKTEKKEIDAYLSIMGVYVNDWKVNFLVERYTSSQDSVLELLQYDFNTDELKTIKEYGKFDRYIKINDRENNKIYIYTDRFIEPEGEGGSGENGLLEINLLDGFSEFYDVEKIFKDNGVYYNDEDFKYDYKISDGRIVATITNPSGYAYSFYTIDLKTKEITEYKDVFDAKELINYGERFDRIHAITLEGDKVYFMSDNFPEREFLIGVVDLNDKKLSFLGKFKGANFTRFEFKNKVQ